MDLRQCSTPERRLFGHREEGQMPWCFILSFERLNLGLPLPSNLPGPPQMQRPPLEFSTSSPWTLILLLSLLWVPDAHLPSAAPFHTWFSPKNQPPIIYTSVWMSVRGKVWFFPGKRKASLMRKAILVNSKEIMRTFSRPLRSCLLPSALNTYSESLRV